MFALSLVVLISRSLCLIEIASEKVLAVRAYALCSTIPDRRIPLS